MNKIEEFLNHVKNVAAKNSIKLFLSNEEYVNYPNSTFDCSGYFIDNGDPSLGVGCNKPLEKWLPILVHEYSHMCQFIEKSEHWINNFEDGKETIDYIEDWMCGSDCDKIEDFIKRSFLVEADCEKRTIEVIKEFELPIDIKEYTQKANSYILYYYMILKKRKWYNKGQEPYSIKELYEKMPNDNIITNPIEILPQFEDLYEKYCF